MAYYRPSGLPVIQFAHIFKTEYYRHVLDVREQFLEIFYVSRGDLLLSSENGSFVANPGDFVCQQHLYPVHVSTDHSHEHHTVGFFFPCTSAESPEELLKTDTEKLAVPGQTFGETLHLPTVIRSCDGLEPCRKLLDEIIMNISVYQQCETICAGKVLELVGTLARICANSKEYSTVSYYLSKAKKYIYDHIREPIHQNELADYLRITPQYLCSVFRTGEGVSVMTFINRVKLEKIRHAMWQDHMLLSEASEMYGYTDPNYVSRLYKKMYNINITDSAKQIHFRYK